MREKTLEALDGEDWGEPPYGSHLVTTCHQLRKKPIGKFTVEDLRIMIGQDVGLPFLMPIALEVLSENPLVSGDFYDGDLLKNVLEADHSEISDDRELIKKMQELALKAHPLVKEMDTIKDIREELLDAINKTIGKKIS